MTVHGGILSRTALLIVILAACADPSGSPSPTPPAGTANELTVEPTVGQVAAGADLPVKFTNGSGDEAFVGELSCVTEYDQLTPDGWRHLASLRMCIEIIRIVAAETTFEYVTPAPDNTGTYRVSIWAHVDGETRVVTSRNFDVLQR